MAWGHTVVAHGGEQRGQAAFETPFVQHIRHLRGVTDRQTDTHRCMIHPLYDEWWVHHAIPTDSVPTDIIPTIHSRDVDIGWLTAVE